MAFSKCDLSLKLVVAAALRYGVVIRSSVISGRAKPIFFLSGCSECLKVFCCLLWPCFGLSLQDKPFVVWLMFIRVGLFMMGSENRKRSLISF